MSGAGSRRKGATFELDVAHYFADNGWPDAHRELERRHDIGDIANGPAGVHIECKNQKQLNLAAWADQTTSGAIVTEAAYGLLVVKRRQKSVGEAYAIMRLEDMCDLLKEAGR